MHTIDNIYSNVSTPVGPPPIEGSKAPSNPNIPVVARSAFTTLVRQGGQSRGLRNTSSTFITPVPTPAGKKTTSAKISLSPSQVNKFPHLASLEKKSTPLAQIIAGNDGHKFLSFITNFDSKNGHGAYYLPCLIIDVDSRKNLLVLSIKGNEIITLSKDGNNYLLEEHHISLKNFYIAKDQPSPRIEEGSNMQSIDRNFIEDFLTYHNLMDGRQLDTSSDFFAAVVDTCVDPGYEADGTPGAATIIENHFLPKIVQFNGWRTEKSFNEIEPPSSIRSVESVDKYHEVTLSSHAYPFNLINSIPLKERTKEFNKFITECKKIIGKYTDPVTIQSILQTMPEISLRVLLRNEPKATQYLIESYKAPYQPYLSKADRRKNEALDRPTKVSFAKKDLEGLDFVSLLPRNLLQNELKEGGELEVNNDNHQYLLKHTSKKLTQTENYKPIFVKDNRTDQDALVLFTEDNEICIIKEDLQDRERMVIEKVDITENHNFTLYNQQLPDPNATDITGKNERLRQRTLALNLLTDSNLKQLGPLSDLYMNLGFYDDRPSPKMNPDRLLTIQNETAKNANKAGSGDQKFILPIEGGGGGGGSKEGTAPSSSINGLESEGAVSSDEEGE